MVFTSASDSLVQALGVPKETGCLRFLFLFFDLAFCGPLYLSPAFRKELRKTRESFRPHQANPQRSAIVARNCAWRCHLWHVGDEYPKTKLMHCSKFLIVSRMNCPTGGL